MQEYDDLDAEIQNQPLSLLARAIPALVVLSAVVGFVTLAWYAYHAGTQALNDDDLMVVEAEKTPLKEKPLDPGGMKFPNQDKTIFETFSNGNSQMPKVERVLPAPEEPMPKQIDTSDTTTWINQNIHTTETEKNAGAPKPEQVIGGDAKKPAPPIATPAAPVVVASAAPPLDKGFGVLANDSKAAMPIDNSITGYKAAPAAGPTAIVAPPAPAKPAAPVIAAKPVAEKAPAPAPDVKTSSAQKVQLGAYRSETEAQDAWGSMQKKIPAMADKSPIIVKADLGEKGIYYRLRTSGFADPAEAKTFCAALSAKGQACILAQ